jgi:hypothetical protein
MAMDLEDVTLYQCLGAAKLRSSSARRASPISAF